MTGRWQGARVQYEADCNLVDLCHCHCSICRRLHGAAFASCGGIYREKFAYVSGEDSIRIYPFSENSDSIFCSHCGSTLLVDFKSEADMLYLALGTVDGDLDCPTGFHQFVASKAPWFTIHDDLPQYDEWPDEDQQDGVI